MDEAHSDAIRRGDSYRVGSGRLDSTTLELAEELGQRLRSDAGLGVVELSFQDGRLQYAWVKQRIRPVGLPDAVPLPHVE
jgi:hypothetical protein